MAATAVAVVDQAKFSSHSPSFINQTLRQFNFGIVSYIMFNVIAQSFHHVKLLGASNSMARNCKINVFFLPKIDKKLIHDEKNCESYRRTVFCFINNRDFIYKL